MDDKVQQSTTGSRLLIFIFCLLVRLCCAWLTRTYDNPDEYWQAQEVAHRMVFGYPFLQSDTLSDLCEKYAHHQNLDR